jgi:hypothetical protein
MLQNFLKQSSGVQAWKSQVLKYTASTSLQVPIDNMHVVIAAFMLFDLNILQSIQRNIADIPTASLSNQTVYLILDFWWNLQIEIH